MNEIVVAAKNYIALGKCLRTCPIDQIDGIVESIEIEANFLEKSEFDLTASIAELKEYASARKRLRYNISSINELLRKDLRR